MSDSQPPKIDSTLAARVAEHFGLPAWLCQRRQCRRKGRCGWIFPSTGEPCCLRNLVPEQRRMFDQLYKTTRAARSHLGHVGLMYASRSAAWRDLEDAAVALAQPLVPRADRRRWNDARRMRDALPPPDR